ncbi:MAG: sulfatase-like hydrolase/transferase [bacterium]|nr:sulfatase-like hydrolase/transferase [bacterium]
MKKKSEHPNLLYIHSDQHSPRVLGCYNDPLVQTPHLDHLAERGTVFENAYCPSPVCTPSRMSMLTGRYPFENEAWTNHHVLDSGIPTMAHAMGAAGYRPVLIGRMHALGTDQLHGYVERPIGDHSSNFPGAGYAPKDLWRSVVNSGSGQSTYQVHDEDVTAATVDFFNRLGVKKRAGESAEPFCLHIGFMLPHSPFVARKEDFDLYKDVMTPPRISETKDLSHPFFQWWREYAGYGKPSEQDVLRARTAYWALVTRMDVMIGEILEAMRKNGLDENTMVVYSSDHGEQVGEKGLWMKRTFYEDSVRVPMIVSWPGVLQEGERCERVVSALDLNATMVEALGADPLPHSRGRSMLGLLRGEAVDWEDVAISEYCLYEGHYQRMIRSGDWKLIYYHGQEPQLFNLAEDPEELNDRAQDPDCREVREELTERVLAGWDPEWVAAKMEEKRVNLEVIRAWVQETNPPEQFRWEVTPGMGFLDEVR